MKGKEFIKRAEYYSKHKEYLEHFQIKQINNIISSSDGAVIKRNVIFLIILFLFKSNHIMMKSFSEYYPKALFNIELTVLLISLVWTLIIRKLIYSGRITAFFKRDYQKSVEIVNFIYKLCLGMKVRAVGIQLLFFSRILSIDTNFNSMTAEYKAMIRPFFIVPTVVLALLYMYYLYYKERYVTVEEYSSRMVEYLKLGLSEQDAFCRLVDRVDSEIGLNSFNGIIYINKTYDPLAKDNESLDWDMMLSSKNM